jgi:predicted phage terminase large subunit-like protein
LNAPAKLWNAAPGALPKIPSREAIRRERERRQRMRDRERVAHEGAAIKARCSSLIEFVEEFWPILEPTRPFKRGWAIEAVCDHLEAVSDGRIQYLLITIPPGMMKSLLVAVFWPAWEWATRDPSLRYLTSSFSRPNVIRDNAKMRRLVESEKYQALYPEVRLDPSSNAKDKFENLRTGNREGRAFESMTGGRGDRVIIDDPHSVDSAESDTQRESVVQTFREAIPDRLNDMTKSAIVVIMQRLHAKDVAGTIIALGMPYVHLNLPMEFEEFREVNGLKVSNRCRTFANDNQLLFEDPRTEEGELLFPERFPRGVVERLRHDKGSYAYAGQYQQRPTAREGGLFKRHWFAGKILDGTTLSKSGFAFVRAWDFASSEEKAGDPDWTAGVLMGRRGTDYYVFGVDRDRLSPMAVQQLVRSRAETDQAGTVIRIPIDPAQAGAFQARSYITALAGYGLKAEKPGTNKVGRALPSSIQAEYGHIWLVNSGPPDAGLDPWIERFLDELCTFPTGAHDDQVDAFADAFNELSLGGNTEFTSKAAGAPLTEQTVERDSRYRFGDKPRISSGRGYGSASSVFAR